MTARNSSNEPTATTDKSIKVFWKGTSKMVADKDGVLVTANAEGLCAEAVAKGDLLTYDGREWPVMGTEPAMSLAGESLFRRVLI